MKTSTFCLALALPALLSGCHGSLDESRFATGSHSVVAGSNFDSLHVVDPDGGTVSTIDLETEAIEAIELGGEPTRLTRAGERIFVTLRTERRVAVLEETDTGLRAVDSIATGAEPYGVVAREDGERLYVASSLSGTVTEFDGQTLAELRSWAIDDEPRWLALTPDGDALFVASARRGTLTRVGIHDGGTTEIALPRVESFNQFTGEQLQLRPRITGDPAISPNGRTLAVPVLVADNISPVLGAGEDLEIPFGEDGESMVVETEIGMGGYSSGSRFTPGVITLRLDPRGEVVTDRVSTIDVTASSEDFGVVNSYPGSVTFTPGGESMAVTLEGAGAVVSVRLGADPSIPDESLTRRPVSLGEEMVDFSGPMGPVLETRRKRASITAAGPRGVAFVDRNEAWVHSFLDRRVERLTTPEVVRKSSLGPGEDAFLAANRTRDPIRFADETLPLDIAYGRRLFYAANNSRMAADGAGVSCATCHFDGRNDGLTWHFDDGSVARQTPSLAGVVSLTTPLTWTDDVETIEHEVMLTSQGRMGGSGLSEGDAARVAAFIDSTREADVPLAQSEDESIVRGRAIFTRKDVGCANCHNGIAYTDNEAYDMYGLDRVRTRSLVGIAASAPYFHDGSAPTLRAVIERARDGSMGDTGSLSEAEADDLEAFLRSL